MSWRASADISQNDFRVKIVYVAPRYLVVQNPVILVVLLKNHFRT